MVQPEQMYCAQFLAQVKHGIVYVADCFGGWQVTSCFAFHFCPDLIPLVEHIGQSFVHPGTTI